MTFDQITDNEKLWAVRFDNNIIDKDSFHDYLKELQ